MDQDRGETRERNQVDQAGQREHAHEQQHAVHDGRHSALRARIDVDRAAHDHRGDRQAADRTGDEIADALRLQFAIGLHGPALRIDLLDRFEAQQRFEARDDGQRDRDAPHVGIGELREVRAQLRVLQRRGERRERFEFRQRDALRGARRDGRCDCAEHERRADAEHDDRERGRHRARPCEAAQHARIPCDQQRERHDGDRGRGPGGRLSGPRRKRLRGRAADAECERNLLDDQQHADRGEHALDDG